MVTRRKLLVTGAAGGVGRTCARLLGTTHDLVLTDRASPEFQRFVEEMRAEGYVIAGVHEGYLGDEALLSALAGDLVGDVPFTLLHTAGVSPAQADWQAILTVNVVATELLLRLAESRLTEGTVAILIASAAGYRVPVVSELQAVLDAPLAAGTIEQAGALIAGLASAERHGGMEALAYSFSKQAVQRMCERRAASWGARGARIVTISPGLMLTPMGRQEMARSPGAAAMSSANPVGRTGTAMDVALAARFLASEEASFITGCDLRIDGGVIAGTRG